MFLKIPFTRTTCFFLLSLAASFAAFGKYPQLPEPVANNAVTYVKTAESEYLLSFMGLGAGKTWQDVHNKAWKLKLGDNSWQAISPVPSSLSLKGRLASVAASVSGQAYLFGGYTVAEDHSEISSPDNFRYDPSTDKYYKIAPTPVPVDDAVALVYKQRYIYLISGWHNDGNVNLVQLYDTHTDSWTQSSPFLGQAVFGHAGGINGNTMVICDGVKVIARKDKRRTFAPEAACYKGTVDAKQPAKIDWRTLTHPTGTARYRMAAAGDEQGIIFYGGSENPYNYNGIGYNGQPSEPDNKVWIFNPAADSWKVVPSNVKSMDHRGLLKVGNGYLVIGGMGEGQQVSAAVHTIELQ